MFLTAAFEVGFRGWKVAHFWVYIFLFFFGPRVSAASLQWSCCHHAFFAFCRRFLADGLVARSSTSSARRGGGGTNRYDALLILISYVMNILH